MKKLKKVDLSFVKLHEVLAYAPDTGLFVRRKTGQVTGGLTPYGYIQVGVWPEMFLAHRLAWFYMTGEYPIADIDHINGIKTDNRWCNLRTVTHADNMRNTKLYKSSSSGVTGVSWSNKYKKWIAYINTGEKQKFLGNHLNFVDAVKARLEAEAKYGFHKNHGRNIITSEEL